MLQPANEKRVELHHLPTGSVLAWEHNEESLARQLRRAESIAAECAAADEQYRADPQQAEELFESARRHRLRLVRLPRALPGGDGCRAAAPPWDGLSQLAGQDESSLLASSGIAGADLPSIRAKIWRQSTSRQFAPSAVVPGQPQISGKTHCRKASRRTFYSSGGLWESIRPVCGHRKSRKSRRSRRARAPCFCLQPWWLGRCRPPVAARLTAARALESADSWLPALGAG